MGFNRSKADKYLAMVQDYSNPKNETLAEHRKHCEARPGNCPFEKNLQKKDDADVLNEKNSASASALDAAYSDAVKRGDKETLRRMVNKASRVRSADEAETGIPITVKCYHGTPSFGFTVFDPSESDDGRTLFFTDDINTATSYHGGEAKTRVVTNKAYDKTVNAITFTEEEIGRATSDNLAEIVASRGYKAEDAGDGWTRYSQTVNVRGRDVYVGRQTKEGPAETLRALNQSARLVVPKGGNYHVAVSMSNPYVFDDGMVGNGIVESEKSFDHFSSLGIKCSPTMNTRHWAYAAREAGYDGVVFKGLYDNGGKAKSMPANIIVAFSPSQAKSLDLATYDDAGNLIPLSQRFNPNNTDIRY